MAMYQEDKNATAALKGGTYLYAFDRPLPAGSTDMISNVSHLKEKQMTTHANGRIHSHTTTQLSPAHNVPTHTLICVMLLHSPPISPHFPVPHTQHLYTGLDVSGPSPLLIHDRSKLVRHLLLYTLVL